MVDPAPNDVVPLLREADALLNVGRNADAISRLQDAARVTPEDPRIFQLWSRALSELGKNDDAVEKAKEATRLAPDDATGHRVLGRALVRLAMQQRGAPRTRSAQMAVEAAREAARLEPANPNSHLVLAEALMLAKDASGADAEMQEAIQAAPNSVTTWVTASLVALGAKNWNAAITACHRALALDPNNYAALNNLGVALRASGRRKEGSQALARAAARDPGATTARQNLSRAGLRTARIVVMILLIPVGFITHLGLSLYLIFAITSNIFISRRPDLVLRFERWAAPIALFMAGRPTSRRDRSSRDQEPVGTERNPTLESEWTVNRSGFRQTSLGGLIVAATAVLCAVILLSLAIAAPSYNVAFAGALVVFAALAAWRVRILIRRRR
jgi:tetratricopeptide (TPR) repeat protein